jgi:hypothetical protein
LGPRQYFKDNADVHGIDLSLIQPASYVPYHWRFFRGEWENGANMVYSIPENVRFSQRDIESPWYGMDMDSWDLIHMRMLNGSISSWPEIYAKIFRFVLPSYI